MAPPQDECRYNDATRTVAGNAPPRNAGAKFTRPLTGFWSMYQKHDFGDLLLRLRIWVPCTRNTVSEKSPPTGFWSMYQKHDFGDLLLDLRIWVPCTRNTVSEKFSVNRFLVHTLSETAFLVHRISPKPRFWYTGFLRNSAVKKKACKLVVSCCFPIVARPKTAVGPISRHRRNLLILPWICGRLVGRL